MKYDGDKLNANKSDDDKDFFAKATGEKALTGNGVVTEVFVDGTDKTVDVAIIEYYAAEVLKVDEDDKTITLSDLDEGPALTTDEFDSTLFEEDEIVIYSYANGDIQDVYAAEKMEGEVTRVRAVTDDSNGDNFVVGGTTYKYNKTALANRLTTDNVDNDVVAYDDYDFTVYTGVKNVPDIDGRAETEVVVATEKDSNVAKVVYIEDADTAGTGEVIFAEANPKAKRVKDTEIGNWYEINAVVGGEIVTLQVKENSTAADKLVKNVAAGVVALKSVTENADGLVTSVKLYDGYNDGDGYVTGIGTEKAEKSTVMLKSIDQINDSNARYAWTDDVVVVRYDYKGDFNISRISSIKDDDNDGYIAVLDGDVITGICVLEKDDKGPQKPQEEKGLALNSLSFSDKGMKINFTNNSGAEFQTGAKADVVVKNSKGTQVCSIKGVQVTDGSVADKASATITFSEYTAVPSTTGEYTVTLTITAGHGTFTVTDVLGTI